MCPNCGKQKINELKYLKMKEKYLQYKYKCHKLSKMVQSGGGSNVWYYMDGNTEKIMSEDSTKIIDNIYSYLKNFKDIDVVDGEHIYRQADGKKVDIHIKYETKNGDIKLFKVDKKGKYEIIKK